MSGFSFAFGFFLNILTRIENLRPILFAGGDDFDLGLLTARSTAFGELYTGCEDPFK